MSGRGTQVGQTEDAPICTDEKEILSNGKMPPDSLTESLRRDNDDRRHILVYKEKVQLLEDKR